MAVQIHTISTDHWPIRPFSRLRKANNGRSSDFIAGDSFTFVDIQCYVVLWFFAEAFPYQPQNILQDLKGQLPWVQAWFDRVHARPACVAARNYREKCMAEQQPTARSTVGNVPAVVSKSREASQVFFESFFFK